MSTALKALNTKTLIAILSAVLLIGGLMKTMVDRSNRQTELMEQLVANSLQQTHDIKATSQIVVEKPRQTEAKNVPLVTPVKPMLLP